MTYGAAIVASIIGVLMIVFIVLVFKMMAKMDNSRPKTEEEKEQERQEDKERLKRFGITILQIGLGIGLISGFACAKAYFDEYGWPSPIWIVVIVVGLIVVGLLARLINKGKD